MAWRQRGEGGSGAPWQSLPSGHLHVFGQESADARPAHLGLHLAKGWQSVQAAQWLSHVLHRRGTWGLSERVKSRSHVRFICMHSTCTCQRAYAHNTQGYIHTHVADGRHGRRGVCREREEDGAGGKTEARLKGAPLLLPRVPRGGLAPGLALGVCAGTDGDVGHRKFPDASPCRG